MITDKNLEKDFVKRAKKIKAKYSSASKIWDDDQKNISITKKILRTAPRKTRGRLSNVKKG